MPFKAILMKLVEDTSHASGAVVADWEGEAVEHYCLYDEYELKLLSAHKGIILNWMKDLHVDLVAGELRDVVITTGKLSAIIGVVGPEYSLVMTLAREAMIGPALFRFRQSVKILEKEIY